MPPDEPDIDAEFRRLFWAAWDEHGRLKERATRDFPAHKSALEFARAQTWPWAETLLEVSLLLEAGSPEQPFRLLAETEPAIPERWRSYFQFVQAEVLLSRGDYANAIRTSRNLLDDPTFDAPQRVLNNLGRAFHESGEFEEAIKAYRTALGTAQSDVLGMIWHNLGVTHHSLGDNEQAIQAYRQALANPKYLHPTYTWNNLGDIFFQQGDSQKAVDAYRNAVDDLLFFPPAGAWYRFGVALSANSEFDEAIHAFRQTLSDPDFESRSTACSDLGHAYLQAGEYDKSINAYHRVLRDPQSENPADVWMNLGITHQSIGEYDQAIHAYRKALGPLWTGLPTGPPLSTGSLPNMDADHSKQGDLRSGKWHGQETVPQLACENPAFVWANLAEAYLSAGRPELAEPAFLKALEHPDPTGEDHARARAGIERLKQPPESGPG